MEPTWNCIETPLTTVIARRLIRRSIQVRHMPSALHPPLFAIADNHRQNLCRKCLKMPCIRKSLRPSRLRRIVRPARGGRPRAVHGYPWIGRENPWPSVNVLITQCRPPDPSKWVIALPNRAVLRLSQVRIWPACPGRSMASCQSIRQRPSCFRRLH